MKKITLMIIGLLLCSLTSCHHANNEWNSNYKNLSHRHSKQKFKNNFGFVPLYDDEDYISLSPSAVFDYETKEENISKDHVKILNEKQAVLFKNIHFDFDSFAIKGEQNLKTLKEISSYLHKNPKVKIFIEGHTDERGTANYNLALGSKRANKVRSFLIEKGVSPEQLITVSYGKEKPISLEQTEQAWQKNRRAEFKLYER